MKWGPCCVCVRARMLAWALRVCLLGAECWADWGSEGVLIDFGHTSLLLKIPWLLLFCSRLPLSVSLPLMKLQMNWITYRLLSFSQLHLLSLPISLCSFFPLPVFVFLRRSPCWFLHCSPSSSLSRSSSSSLALYHFRHTLSLCALLAYSLLLSIFLSISTSLTPSFLSLPPFISSIHIRGRECAAEMLPTSSS